MTYDLHGVWDGEHGDAKVRPHTDLRDIDRNIQMLLNLGVKPEKVNLAWAYYARAYTLADPKCQSIECPFKGPSRKGRCSQFPGYLMNSEIGDIIRDNHLTPQLLRDSMVKLVTWGDQWIAYDDKETYAAKLDYANERCLGGVFIWSLDYIKNSEE